METEWFVKMTEMRESIAKMNLTESHATTPPYGSDFGLNDDEFLYGSESDNLWDLLGDESDDTSEGRDSPSYNGNLSVNEQHETPKFDREWLTNQCAVVASRSSGLETQALNDQILAILASDSSGMNTGFMCFGKY